MRNILAIVERELRSYFSSPIAYVVLTLFVLLTGIAFQAILGSVLAAPGGPGAGPRDMPGLISENFLSFTSEVLLFMTPMITMALFAEEKKRGTMELLLTAPITDTQVVLGKFLSAVSFFAILLITTWVPMSVLYLYGKPASGPILAAYLGLLLYGFAIMAMGMFLSTLTENQIIAAVLAFGTIILLLLMDAVGRRAENAVLKAVLSYVSIISHLENFFKGVLVTSDIIFYLSLTFIALFLTYRSVDSLRWRA